MGAFQSRTQIPLPAGIRQNLSDDVAQAVLDAPGDNEIVGSYVYKRLVRGEEVDDVDCISDNSWKASHHLQKTRVLGAIPGTSENFEELFDDYTALTVQEQGESVNVDLISKQEYHREVGDKTFINTVKMTKNGLIHRDGDTHRPGIQVQRDAEVRFVVERLQRDQYCPWSNMREKDKEYFRKFAKIPDAECKANGF
jgi:hypothetical protein